MKPRSSAAAAALALALGRGMPVVCRAGLILALLVPAGCGFQPLYGESSAVESANLAGVRVMPIQDVPDLMGRTLVSPRAAQELRNSLVDRIVPRGQPSVAKFELQVRLSESKSTVLGTQSNETATRSTLVLTASYWLARVDGQGLVLNSYTRSDVSYNILNDQFATLSAENDARRRAVREISQTIALEVANAVGTLGERAAK